MSQIRPLAICIFSHYGKILVSEEFDSIKAETFYRPLGGAIEFGERSTDTIHRELMEEIGAEVKNLVYLGAMENIYIYNGIPGHEIVQVYDGELADSQLYDQALIVGHEPGMSLPMKVIWKSLEEFGPDKDILYPDGLLEMLRPRD